MNFHNKFQEHRKNIRNATADYIEALSTLTAYAAYVATLKDLKLTEEPNGYADCKKILNDSKNLAKEWVNTTYLIMINTPKAVTQNLDDMMGYLNTALGASGSTSGIVSDRFTRAILNASTCCDSIIAKYTLVNNSIDDYQDTFDNLKTNLEKAKAYLLSFNDIENEIYDSVESMIDDLKQRIAKIAVKFGWGVVNGVAGLAIVNLGPVGLFLGVFLFIFGVIEILSALSDLKELVGELNNLISRLTNLSKDIININSTMDTVNILIDLHDSLSGKVGFLIYTWKNLSSEMSLLQGYIDDASFEAPGHLGNNPAQRDVEYAIAELKGIIDDNKQLDIGSFNICTDSINLTESSEEMGDVLNKSNRMEIVEYVKEFG